LSLTDRWRVWLAPFTPLVPRPGKAAVLGSDGDIPPESEFNCHRITVELRCGPASAEKDFNWMSHPIERRCGPEAGEKEFN
jgi:hypothetical protein